MRHSSLASFLNGELPADELWRQIETEVGDCIAACAKGGTGHVIITHGSDTLVAPQQVSVLLTALADDKLPLDAASYIADALIMSENFEWDDASVAEALFFLCDESAPLTLAKVEDALSRLVAVP